MRIAIISTYPASGVVPDDRIRKRYRNAEHASSWIRALCIGLAQRKDVCVRLFVHSRAVRQGYVGELEGVPIEFIPKREPARLEPYHLYLPGIFSMRRAMRAFAPDIICGFGMETGNAQIAVHQSQPAVVAVQGMMSEVSPYMSLGLVRRFIHSRLEGRNLRKAAGIIVENGYAERWVLSCNSNATPRVIPHAVCPEFFEVRSDRSSRVILCIGSLCEHKGTDVVIRAFAEIKSIGVRLAIIGDGLSSQSYRDQAVQLGIADRMDFLGRLSRADIVRHMQSAKMLVLGSRMDTSPNVITEAHAAGLPVVATRVGGIPEMIEDGASGFLVDSEDHRAMAKKMDMLVDNPDLCRSLGENGKESVRKRHDPDDVAQAYVWFFEEVLQKQRGIRDGGAEACGQRKVQQKA
jgi:glycosyltransferase involved in cell wall biosynthesis